MIARYGRSGSYFTSVARLVTPNIAAATGPMQQRDAPTAAAMDAAMPARASRCSFRTSIMRSASHPPRGDTLTHLMHGGAGPFPDTRMRCHDPLPDVDRNVAFVRNPPGGIIVQQIERNERP